MLRSTSVQLGFQLRNAGNHFADTDRQQQDDCIAGRWLMAMSNTRYSGHYRPAPCSANVNCFTHPSRTITTCVKMTEPEITQDYRFPHSNSIPSYLGNTAREVKERPADCIRIDEAAAALTKMKRHKAPGLSRLLAEMIQTTGDIGTQ